MTGRSARLLPADETGTRLLDLRTLEAHTQHYGAMPLVSVAPDGKPGALVDELHTAGLRGRGGGWFPTSRKMHAVVESAAARRALSSGRKTVVIANAMEGEPASSKDVVLLSHSPHLVLDGIQAAARSIGATNAYIAVHRGSPVIGIIDAAIAERGGIDTVPVELITPPARYVASKESALAHWAGDGIATTVYGDRPFQRGMNGRPTLVQNAETLAHIALIARHGGAWFASVGDPAAPGTTLVSVGGAVAMPGVIEVATGTPVRAILQRCGGESATVQGFLTGGYGGAWVKAEELIDTPWAPDSVANTGGVIGAGIFWALDDQHCGIRELASVSRWMAAKVRGNAAPAASGFPQSPTILPSCSLRRPMQKHSLNSITDFRLLKAAVGASIRMEQRDSFEPDCTHFTRNSPTTCAVAARHTPLSEHSRSPHPVRYRCARAERTSHEQGSRIREALPGSDGL